MIGPITDSCALFVGGLAGTLFSGFIPKRVKETLPLIFGVITLCMGSTLVNKASLTQRAIRHSLARNLTHLVLRFSLCWHAICKAPEILLRGFLSWMLHWAIWHTILSFFQ